LYPSLFYDALSGLNILPVIFVSMGFTHRFNIMPLQGLL
jgi:hypothetical protein